jgi:hypothetical protein
MKVALNIEGDEVEIKEKLVEKILLLILSRSLSLP